VLAFLVSFAGWRWRCTAPRLLPHLRPGRCCLSLPLFALALAPLSLFALCSCQRHSTLPVAAIRSRSLICSHTSATGTRRARERERGLPQGKSTRATMSDHQCRARIRALSHWSAVCACAPLSGWSLCGSLGLHHAPKIPKWYPDFARTWFGRIVCLVTVDLFAKQGDGNTEALALP